MNKCNTSRGRKQVSWGTDINNQDSSNDSDSDSSSNPGEDTTLVANLPANVPANVPVNLPANVPAKPLDDAPGHDHMHTDAYKRVDDTESDSDESHHSGVECMLRTSIYPQQLLPEASVLDAEVQEMPQATLAVAVAVAT